MYVAKELWHGRSAREPFAKDVGRAMWRSINESMLVRCGAFTSADFFFPFFFLCVCMFGGGGGEGGFVYEGRGCLVWFGELV